MQNNDYHIKGWLVERFSADYKLKTSSLIQRVVRTAYVGSFECGLDLIWAFHPKISSKRWHLLSLKLQWFDLDNSQCKPSVNIQITDITVWYIAETLTHLVHFVCFRLWKTEIVAFLFGSSLCSHQTQMNRELQTNWLWALFVLLDRYSNTLGIKANTRKQDGTEACPVVLLGGILILWALSLSIQNLQHLSFNSFSLSVMKPTFFGWFRTSYLVFQKQLSHQTNWMGKHINCVLEPNQNQIIHPKWSFFFTLVHARIG